MGGSGRALVVARVGGPAPAAARYGGPAPGPRRATRISQHTSPWSWRVSRCARQGARTATYPRSPAEVCRVRRVRPSSGRIERVAPCTLPARSPSAASLTSTSPRFTPVAHTLPPTPRPDATNKPGPSYSSSARRSAWARSAGSSELTSTSSPVTGCVKAQAARRAGTGARGRRLRAPVLRVSAHGVADRRHVHADLMRAARLEARPAAGCARQRRSISKCVRASRGSSASIDMSVRSRRSRPIGASIVPVRAAGRPSTSARYSRLSRRVGEQRLQRAVDLLALGHHQQPGCVAVEPVHDPGPPGLARRRRRAAPGPARACPCGDPGPGARRPRPACRRRAGARPRRRP